MKLPPICAILFMLVSIIIFWIAFVPVWFPSTGGFNTTAFLVGSGVGVVAALIGHGVGLLLEKCRRD